MDPEDDKSKVNYGFGWLVRAAGEGKANYWHTGSLPGTAALVVLRHDQKAWVVLFNSRVSPTANHLGKVIDPLLHRAANAVRNWPEDDLF